MSLLKHFIHLFFFGCTRFFIAVLGLLALERSDLIEVNTRGLAADDIRCSLVAGTGALAVGVVSVSFLVAGIALVTVSVVSGLTAGVVAVAGDGVVVLVLSLIVAIGGVTTSTVVVLSLIVAIGGVTTSTVVVLSLTVALGGVTTSTVIVESDIAITVSICAINRTADSVLNGLH